MAGKYVQIRNMDIDLWDRFKEYAKHPMYESDASKLLRKYVTDFVLEHERVHGKTHTVKKNRQKPS